LIGVAAAAALLGFACASSTTEKTTARTEGATGPVGPKRALLIVVPGLRPDDVTPATMPALDRLAREGAVFENHRSAFPTSSMVNVASMATGAYPRRHGVMGETMLFSELADEGPIDLTDADDLARINAATAGGWIGAASLGASLPPGTLAAIGGGSGGAAAVLARGARDARRTPIEMQSNVDLDRPEASPAPVAQEGGVQWMNETRMRIWEVNAAKEALIQEIENGSTKELTVLLLDAMEQLRGGEDRQIVGVQIYAARDTIDTAIGDVHGALSRSGLLDDFNIIVASDRAYPRAAESPDLTAWLIERGFKQSADSTDVVVAGNAIHVAGRNREVIRSIAQRLQGEPWVEAVFTHRARPGHPEGFVPGTFSFHAVHAEHARNPDLWVFAGPIETRATLIAFGPSFKRGVRSAVPSAVYDVAPTLLALVGATPPASMDGRVLTEALRGGPDPADVPVRRVRHGSEIPGGEHRLEILELGVGRTDYFDGIELHRN
jgi:hypothetical protein